MHIGFFVVQISSHQQAWLWPSCLPCWDLLVHLPMSFSTYMRRCNRRTVPLVRAMKVGLLCERVVDGAVCFVLCDHWLNSDIAQEDVRWRSSLGTQSEYKDVHCLYYYLYWKQILLFSNFLHWVAFVLYKEIIVYKTMIIFIFSLAPKRPARWLGQCQSRK